MLSKAAAALPARVGGRGSVMRYLSRFRSQQGASRKSALAGTRLLASMPTGGDMLCFQCEQTEDNKGCTKIGVCGKTPEVSALQDLLVDTMKDMSGVAKQARDGGVVVPEADAWALNALFATLTNVNFDADRFVTLLDEAKQQTESIRAECERRGVAVHGGVTSYGGKSVDELHSAGRTVGLEVRSMGVDPDVVSLQELVTYGLKGMAAYAAHANELDKSDPEVAGLVYEALEYISRPTEAQEADRLLGLALEVGRVNIRAMELLNEGHKEKLGVPAPTRVRTSPVPGKCLLVSGHDMADLKKVLELTEGKGINVYTHGEMLPGHAYPELAKHKHLVGNFGGAWQLQKFEFAEFPGPILVTTNCLVEPRKSYRSRLFTTNAVGWEGVTHLDRTDFSQLVDAALESEGFDSEDCEEEKESFTMTGFGHDAVLGIADKVVEAVQSGKISNFFLIGGCDGSEGERSYYRHLATSLPNDAVVLTLGCAKYRFNKMFDEFGTVPGTELPRMLDVGQCNDAYSAVQIALALAKAFKTDVNGLPLHMVLSWFEQKAVAVLLSLLHLNVQNIRIGPNLPAFITPGVLDVLVDKYNLAPISTVDDDLRSMLKA